MVERCFWVHQHFIRKGKGEGAVNVYEVLFSLCLGYSSSQNTSFLSQLHLSLGCRSGNGDSLIYHLPVVQLQCILLLAVHLKGKSKIGDLICSSLPF